MEEENEDSGPGILDFFRAISELFPGESDDSNQTEVRASTTCEDPLIDDLLFYRVALAPAAIIVISFSFTQARRNVLLDTLRGRPGILNPMSIATSHQRVSYACAFGSTVYLIVQCIFENFRIFPYSGDLPVKGLILLASVIVFGIVYLPVFACLTMGSFFGYGLGALYVWMLTIVSCVRLFNCDASALSRFALILSNAPYLFCLIYLSLSIPKRLYKAFRDRRFFVHAHEKSFLEVNLEELRQTDAGLHVRNLLARKKDDKKEMTVVDRKTKIKNFILDHTYRQQPGFKYSARLLSTLFVSTILLYRISFEIFTQYIEFYHEAKKIVKELEEEDEYIHDLAAKFLRYGTGIILGALSISTLLGLYSIMRLLIGYRNTLYLVYRGDTSITIRGGSYIDLMIGAIKYSGFQVVYIVWGFVVHMAVFLVFCAILAFVFNSIVNDSAGWLVVILNNLWPVLLWAILVTVVQKVLVRFIFLQFPQKSLDLTNRRGLFLFTYFIFFYNIFLGLFSCLLRIIKAIVLGALLLPRLDRSTLPATYDHMDPGYVAYVGFMKLECSQTHPAMLIFLRILICCARERRLKEGQNAGKKGWVALKKQGFKDVVERFSRRRAAVFHWLVLYTLINNPDLRILRKGYVQKLKLAKERGIIIPKSDTFVDIEKVLRAEEAKTQGAAIKALARSTEFTVEEIPMVVTKGSAVPRNNGRHGDVDINDIDTGMLYEPKITSRSSLV